MSIVIDANMKLFADRMNITSSRMIRDYGLSSVDEIIEAEAEKGNSKAISYAREYYHSPEKLMKIFELLDVENKYSLIYNMKNSTREKLLPYLNQEDLVMGLYFFTQEKLLAMLSEVEIEELVNVVRDAFSLDEIVMMYSEDDLAQFFKNDDLEKRIVIEQIKSMPPEVMQKFIEGVTGMPQEKTNSDDFIKNIESLSDDSFKKFMSMIDPDVQRQLTFQLIKTDTDYMTMFGNTTYLNMLNKMMKPEMVKPMIMLNKESLVKMIGELPRDLIAIVGAQIEAREFAKFLQDGHMDLIERALMI